MTSPSRRIEAAGVSHPGRHRKHNEDAYGVHVDLGLFVVADGMGGHAGGEVASHLAVSTVAAHVGELGKGHTGETSELLAEAVQRANAVVFGAARESAAESDMGTTIACLLVRGDQAAVAHVGDSRVYSFRDGRLSPLTDDHSLLAECLRSGYITPDLAEAFPYKHLITRSLGADEVVQVDTRVVEPQAGDMVLLCSDGLSGVISDEDIARVLVSEPALEAAAQRLIERANYAGGPDNVTVILVRWLD